MPAVHFTGTRYTGSDGATPLSFTQPGHYQVGEEKAVQLTADFPQQFSLVMEGEVKEAETKAEKPATSDETSEKVPTPSQDEQAPAEATTASEKPSKKK